ncbi:hypothetical protein AMECASPLE_034977 [Ameca splendens]|uniref:Uncharacterized protein n=1 Tax=Ameca splendens TaxID=208324 RepID=A0ABV0YIB3_9TELE
MGAGWEWESIYQEWDGTGFFSLCWPGIGTGQDFFLWERDGTGEKIHSRVTLYYGHDVTQCKQQRYSLGLFLMTKFISKCSMFHLLKQLKGFGGYFQSARVLTLQISDI